MPSGNNHGSSRIDEELEADIISAAHDNHPPRLQSPLSFGGQHWRSVRCSPIAIVAGFLLIYGPSEIVGRRRFIHHRTRLVSRLLERARPHASTTIDS
jgi:hypothetical protein